MQGITREKTDSLVPRREIQDYQGDSSRKKQPKKCTAEPTSSVEWGVVELVKGELVKGTWKGG